MRIEWTFEPSDIEAVQKVVKQYEDREIVQERKEKNLSSKKTLPTREEFWKASVHGVLTSVQKYDRIQPFLDAEPFELRFAVCATCTDLKKKVVEKLAGIDGFRFKGETRADFICANFKAIGSNNWDEIQAELQRLINEQTKDAERRAAEFISSPRLKGIGPKQSRNVLQMLHLTRYEIPIDSRITNWLVSIGCPVQLSAGLGDYEFYLYVENKIQELCDKADVMPCVFDGAIWEANVRKKKRQPSAS